MDKKIFIGIGVLILASLAWASNDPWNSKPFQKWDKADLQLILSNSPWNKKVVVEVNWKRSASAGRQSEAQSGGTPLELQEHMQLSKGGPPDSAPPDASMTSSAASGGTSTSLQAVFYIRWYSSRVIREALVREAILNGKISEQEGTKVLTAPVGDYEITLFGPDMTPFQTLTEEQLKSASYLEGKQSKQKAVPASVRMNRTPGGRIYSLVFFFPKQTTSGAEIASPQEKGFEFGCKVKGLDLHTAFDTRKMVDEKGADF